MTVTSIGHDERLALKTARLKEVVPVYLMENDDHLGTDEIYAQGEQERFFLLSQSIPTIIDRLTDSIAIGYVAGSEMDSNALQRAAASVMQESLREAFVPMRRILTIRETGDYLLTLLTLDNKEDVVYL